MGSQPRLLACPAQKVLSADVTLAIHELAKGLGFLFSDDPRHGGQHLLHFGWRDGPIAIDIKEGVKRGELGFERDY